jgi:PHD/YefM family antitoxin component YafN of YafNO toxin-antitoxin module
MRQVAEQNQAIVIEHSGKPHAVLLSMETYERLLAAQEAQQDWRDLVARARAQVRVDLDGRTLPSPETILRETREARDDQLDHLC